MEIVADIQVIHSNNMHISDDISGHAHPKCAIIPRDARAVDDGPAEREARIEEYGCRFGVLRELSGAMHPASTAFEDGRPCTAM